MGQTVKRGENGEITHIKVGNSFVEKNEHEIRVRLESLVGNRFTKESLEKTLSIIFILHENRMFNKVILGFFAHFKVKY